MTLTKRISIATFVGFLCGLICVGLASGDPSQPISMEIKLAIITGRTLMGFVIGISQLKLKWWQHGLLLGFITSIPMAVPVFSQPTIFIGTFVMGILYGFLIELVTSVIFKAKKRG